MAEEGGLTIPGNTNWSEWSFSQVLLAITGDSIDLKKAIDVEWLAFKAGGGAADSITYKAWEKYYYAANYDYDAFNKWNTLVQSMDTIARELYTNRRGTLDLWTLRDAQVKVVAYESWLRSSGQDYRAWAKHLDSDDDGFNGKAAAIIQYRMDVNADKLEDLHEQLTTNHGVPASRAMKNAQDAMDRITRKLADAWFWARNNSNIASLPNTEANAMVQGIYDHLMRNGIIRTEEAISNGTYVLDKLANGDDRAVALAHIDSTMAAWTYGNLTNGDTWKKMNDQITTRLQAVITELDNVARQAMADLHQNLVTATSAMTALKNPKFSKPPTGGFGDPPPGLEPPPPPPDVEIPPPPDIETPPPPDVETPPPPDVTAPGADGDQLLSRLANTTLAPADGGAGSGLDANGNPIGDSGFFESVNPLLPLSAARSWRKLAATDPAGGTGTGLDANGDPLPGFDADGNPLPGFDANGNPLPGFDAAGNPLPGFDAAGNPIDDFGSAGGAIGSGGGAAGFGGGAIGSGYDGSIPATGSERKDVGGIPTMPAGMTLPPPAVSQLSGGAPGLGGMGLGGMPMMPPMMGGMGHGNNESKERERQTWLSEDEDVWGINAAAGIGVIGRPGCDDHEVEESLVTAAPSRPSRHSPEPATRTAHTEQTEAVSTGQS